VYSFTVAGGCCQGSAKAEGGAKRAEVCTTRRRQTMKHVAGGQIVTDIVTWRKVLIKFVQTELVSLVIAIELSAV